MSALAIITARGGSKRIPKKNIKEFCGKPILAYSIEAAIESHIFDEVMVSTDSTEIAKIAEDYGANIPFMRSSETSNDFATTMDVIREVVDSYKNLGKQYDYIMCIYPTAPFVTANKIRMAYDEFRKSDAEALTSVVSFSFPPQRAFVMENKHLFYKWPENYVKRSQDLEKLYHDAGQFYIYRSAAIKKNVVDMRQIPFELPETEVQDIDNETDWKIAEIKYKLMMEN